MAKIKLELGLHASLYKSLFQRIHLNYELEWAIMKF